MRLLVRFVVGFFAVLGIINVADLVFTPGEWQLVGGSPLLDARGQVGGVGPRIISLPMLETEFRRAAVINEDYYFCDRRSGGVLRIPRGYRTDFASMPVWARPLVDRLGNSLEPAGVHDWLYAVAETGADGDGEAERAFADRVFRDALDDNRVGLATRSLMYLAVRVGGGEPYRNPPPFATNFPSVPGVRPTWMPEPPERAFIARLASCAGFEPELNRLAECFATPVALPPAGWVRARCEAAYPPLPMTELIAAVAA